MTQNNVNALFDFDKKNAHNFDFVIGTDEAGRGPGAGPVHAAAVCFTSKLNNEDIEKLKILNDSKQLTEKKREKLYEVIKTFESEGKCICSIQTGSVEQIEKINILNTSLDCMKRACSEVLNNLDTKAIVLVDGNKSIKNFTNPQMTVVKGDAKSASIAAASILAKVSRDRFMDNLAKQFPQYGWDKNKGYLSSAHIGAIKEFGATKWHRKKFLRNILPQEESEAESQTSQLTLGI